MKSSLLHQKLKLIGVALVIVMSMIFSVKAVQATYYEVKGKVEWDGKLSRKAKLFLLREGHESYRRVKKGDRKINHISYQDFDEVYKDFKKRKTVIDTIANKKKRSSARKLLIKDFKRTIKQHMVRKIGLSKEGKIYLNIEPGATYYLVGIKNNGLFRKNKRFRFWIENIYFRPGEIEVPKEIVFDENNVMEW